MRPVSSFDQTGISRKQQVILTKLYGLNLFNKYKVNKCKSNYKLLHGYVVANLVKMSVFGLLFFVMSQVRAPVST